jgi:hypothetical protein
MNWERLGYLLMVVGAVLTIIAFKRASVLWCVGGIACFLWGWYLARRARRDADLDDAAGMFDDLTGADIDLD